MKVLSLFDGISCGQIALERAGINVDKYYASEIDKYAIQIAQKNYPNTIQLGDVSKIGYHKKGFLYSEKGYIKTKIDLLIGGSPCQDLSIAKKDRQGLDGARSGLFWEYARALKEIQPKYFLFENVASMPKEAKAVISEVLGVEPILINSALVSAQQRKRLYWTNIKGIEQPKDKGIYLKDILESGVVQEEKSETIKFQYAKTAQANYFRQGSFHAQMIFEPIILSNSTLPQSQRVYSVQGKSICLNSGGGGGGAKTGLYKIDLLDGDYIIRKLTPIECERLQTLPEGYTEGISNTQRYKCIGNGWTVDVIAWILSYLGGTYVDRF